MASKATAPIILGLGLGALALVLLTRGAKAAPPEEAMPTVEKIMGARSFAELNAYYDWINELYITGKIDMGAYMVLYEAYSARFYELMEGS